MIDASILSVGSCVPNTKRVSSLKNDRMAPVVVTEVANGLRWRTAVCANKSSACGAYFLSYLKKIIGFQIDPIAATPNNERMITVAARRNGELPANVEKNPLRI